MGLRVMSDFILFKSGKSEYAMEVEVIERIDQLSTFTVIPNAHPFIDGMMLYGSDAIKVVDFRKMTSNALEIHETLGNKLLIYKSPKGLFAIKVDEIEEIVSFDESQIKPYAHQVRVGDFIHTRGVVEYKNELIMVVGSVVLPEDGAGV